MYQPHAEWSESRNDTVERARMLASGNVWVWEEVSEAVTVKEHGYLRARDDDTRGEYMHDTTIIPSELIAQSIGYNATPAIRSPRD